MFISNFCEEEWIFPKVVNLVHESMFSHLLVVMLQKKDLSSEPMVSW